MTKSAYKKHIYQYIGFVVMQLFLLSTLSLGGCNKEESSALQQEPSVDSTLQQEVSVDDSNAKERIERIIGTNLPATALNCKYHLLNLGLGVIYCYGYFEIPRTDLLSLLDTTEHLPDTSELAEDSDAISMIEWAAELLEERGEKIEWWKPSELEQLQYAYKHITGSARGGIVGLTICTDVLRDDLMGVYLVYHAD